jgi:hypothetical protein
MEMREHSRGFSKSSYRRPLLSRQLATGLSARHQVIDGVDRASSASFDGAQ